MSDSPVADEVDVDGADLGPRIGVVLACQLRRVHGGA
mgnify:CR=1 FL=1